MPSQLDPNSRTARFHMVMPNSLKKQIDAWRRRQATMPNRSDAIRKLILRGLAPNPAATK